MCGRREKCKSLLHIFTLRRLVTAQSFQIPLVQTKAQWILESSFPEGSSQKMQGHRPLEEVS